jgi:hypothetical protein
MRTEAQLADFMDRFAVHEQIDLAGINPAGACESPAGLPPGMIC